MASTLLLQNNSATRHHSATNFISATQHQLATRHHFVNSTSINDVNSRNAACKPAKRHQLYHSKTTRQHGINTATNFNLATQHQLATQHRLYNTQQQLCNSGTNFNSATQHQLATRHHFGNSTSTPQSRNKLECVLSSRRKVVHVRDLLL